MYAKLRIELDSSQISYQQSSNLQGVLMEQTMHRNCINIV